MSLWPTFTIKDLTTKVGSGATPRGGEASYKESGTPLIRSLNVHFNGFRYEGLAFLDDAQADELKSVEVRRDDVLLNITGASIGRVTQAPSDLDGARVSQHVCIIRPIDVLKPAFLRWYLNSPAQQSLINREQTGATRQGLTKEKILNFVVPVPSLTEQTRIVAKIEELFSNLDAGVASLKRAKANLKRYRAAVLKAAVEGKLTEAWRAAHPDAEPASKLLERILTERRQKWEADQLAKFTAADKPPPKGWREKYVEPSPPDTTGLPELPEGWCWASSTQVCERIQDGTHFSPGENDQLGEGPYPYITAKNVKPWRLDLTKLTFLKEAVHRPIYDRCDVRNGDVLLVKDGVNAGDAAINNVSGEISLLSSVAFFRPFDGILGAHFLLTYLQSPVGNRNLLGNLTGTAIRRIILQRIRALPIPIAPTDEQKHVAEEVAECLSQIEKAEAVIYHGLLRATRLRQSILKQAFEGKLVPQDPRDEPISNSLLAELAANQQAASKKKRNGSTHEADSHRGEPMDAKIGALLAPFLPGERLAIRLHSLHFDGAFRSLSNVALEFNRRYRQEVPVSPICLVGLNGSGKSNLIELLAIILCDLELSLIGYEKIPPSIRQMRGTPFVLAFSITPKKGKSDGILYVRRITNPKAGVQFSLSYEGAEHVVTETEMQLQLLPTRVVSYSSGLNETLSIPFFRNQAYYSEQVTQEAFGKRKPVDGQIRDITTTYIDYDCNAAILLANFLFRTPHQLSIFKKAIRVKGLESFSISYRLKRPLGGRSVELTTELKEILKKLKGCATKVTALPAVEGEQFHFTVDRDTIRNLKEGFGTAAEFFTCLNKWSQLNSLSLSKRDREYYLRSEDSSAMLKRPPSVSREHWIFLIDDVQLSLSSPDTVVGYTGLSDGEHQFVQVFGSFLLFDEPGTLFLFDEPETHFNPQWRRFFVDFLNQIETTKRQEIVISTHSPFVVSGCRKEGVFKFKRSGEAITIGRCSLETFGCSYEVLLAELFELTAMISELAVLEMKEILKKDDANEIVRDAAKFGESMEKRFLFERAAEIRNKDGQK